MTHLPVSRFSTSGNIAGDQKGCPLLRCLHSQALAMPFPIRRNQPREKKTLDNFGEIKIYLIVKTGSSQESVLKFLLKLKWYIYNGIHSWAGKPNISLLAHHCMLKISSTWLLDRGKQILNSDDYICKTMKYQLSMLAINNVLGTFQIWGNTRNIILNVWLWI